MDSFGSLIFPVHNGPMGGPRGGKRMIAQAPTKVSVDNPLYFGPSGGVTHHSVIERTHNTCMERLSCARRSFQALTSGSASDGTPASGKGAIGLCAAPRRISISVRS